LGSSHTAPCGTVVPARPPTHYRDVSGEAEGSQWAKGYKKVGTWVVVRTRYWFLGTQNLKG
jgi:hypothetical protein